VELDPFMPANEVNAVEPSSLKHMESESQKQMLELLRMSIDVSQSDGSKWVHTLMLGGPGLGKTAVAKVIASELCIPMVETSGVAIRQPADLNGLLLASVDRGLLFIDEAHMMPIPSQTALMVAMTSGKLSLSLGGRLQSLTLGEFSVMLATTDEHLLLQPLRDRCRLTLRFNYYSHADLERILGVRSRSLGWGIAEECLTDIAIRSRGTPRIAFNILQCARYAARSEGSDTILPSHLARATELLGIDDPIGLNVATDLAYLRLLLDGDKPLNVLASSIGLPARTCSTTIEPFLVKSGLIEKTRHGRTLTPKGREHLLGRKVS